METKKPQRMSDEDREALRDSATNGVRCLVCGTTPCRNISPGATAPSVTEPELTPEERERLGKLLCDMRYGSCGYGSRVWFNDAPEGWMQAAESIFREGHAAAMARVREAIAKVRAVDPGQPSSKYGKGVVAGWDNALEDLEKALGQPPAQPDAEPPAKPNAEPAPTWPPPMDTFWTHKQHGGKWRVYWLHWQNPHNGGDGSVELSGTHSDGMGGREVVERARFETEWRPWHEAEASTTAHAPTQDATSAMHERQRAACRSDHRPGPAAMEEAVESLVAKSVAMVERLVAASERIEARVEVVEARFGDMAEWQEGILSRLRGLEERVSVTEAEGARVREQAARTEHALREVVEWLARINRPAPSLAPEVVRARRALGMPETP